MGVFFVGVFSGAVAATLINDVLMKGSFTCYVFKEGEEGMEMITFDYKRKGGG